MASIANRVTFTAGSGSNPRTATLTVSAGTNRKVCLGDLLEVVRTYSSVTFNGNAMTLGPDIDHSGQAGLHAAMWWYDVPDALGAGDYTLSITMSSGSTESQAYGWQLAGVATGAPAVQSDEEAGTGVAGVSSGALTVTDGAVAVGVAITSAGAPTLSWSGLTEYAEGNATNFTDGAADVVVSGTSLTITATESAATGRKCLAAMVFSAQTGPSITTQPSADTAVVSPSEPAVFTVDCAAATTGMQWQDDGTNISGADVSVTDTLATGTSVLTITPTATTRTGSAITCECTDATGTTESSSATLTVRAGVTETATTTTTNASGQTTGTLKTDVRAEGSEMLVAFVALKVNGAELSGAGTGAWFAGLAP